jgi:tRNA dimethylallyltransferase
LAQGLEKEAFSLAQCFGWEVPAFSAIGYREWQAYARGETTRSETITRLHLDTRRYAKRQLTWFKRDRRIEWFSPDEEISIRTTVASYFQNQEN